MLGSTTAGLHVPVIPFNDVLGKVGTLPLPQIVIPVPKENRGTVLGVTVTLIFTGIAQVPAAG